VARNAESQIFEPINDVHMNKTIAYGCPPAAILGRSLNEKSQWPKRSLRAFSGASEPGENTALIHDSTARQPAYPADKPRIDRPYGDFARSTGLRSGVAWENRRALPGNHSRFGTRNERCVRPHPGREQRELEISFPVHGCCRCALQ
jgi:hypothetical protein